MKIETPISRVRRALTTSEATATSFTVTAVLPTFTEPARSATRAVFSRKDLHSVENTTIRVTPFGRDNNNETLSVKAVGWDRIGDSLGGATGPKWLWKSSLICQVEGTMSATLLGLAGAPLAVEDQLCDTLTLTYGVAVLFQGLSDVDTAWFVFDTGGYEYVELLFARGTGTEANALVSF